MNVCILQAAAAGAAPESSVQVCLGIHSPVGMVTKIQLVWCQHYGIGNLKNVYLQVLITNFPYLKVIGLNFSF